ncbi:hypothetical protein J2736_003290 [Paenibacillus qinlingensis]|uniref:Uncharacterized protein n=1 Tax=Paenibacillus qinlingensis TaxID=1837343 RepID=A0ABU1NX71_9BACL|nr:hypothetical protein [Paenibacillus qinlingensis]
MPLTHTTQLYSHRLGKQALSKKMTVEAWDETFLFMVRSGFC